MTGVVAGTVAEAVSGLAEASVCVCPGLPDAVGTLSLVRPVGSAGPPLTLAALAAAAAGLDAFAARASPWERSVAALVAGWRVGAASAPALSAPATTPLGVESCRAGVSAGAGVTNATLALRDAGLPSDLSASVAEADGPCSGNAVSAPSASTWASTEAATAQAPCRQRTGHGRAAAAPAGAEALA